MGAYSSPVRWSLAVIPSPEPTNTVNSPSRVSCCSSSRLSSSPDTKSITLSSIHSSGIIACLRSSSAEIAFEAASAALDGGVSVLEITMSTPGVFQVLQRLVEAYPTACLGVGTVLSADDAMNAMNAGARFIMSPATIKDVMDVVRGTELLYIPGVMTPTEMLFAYTAGAKIVKIYPVSALGGVQYIAALKKPFSHIPMVASQGVTLGLHLFPFRMNVVLCDSVRDYITQGASAVVLSDAIFSKEAMQQRNYNAVHQLAIRASLQGKEAVRSINLLRLRSRTNSSAIEKLASSACREVFGIASVRAMKILAKSDLSGFMFR
ncbi:KHG/KDPG aldolase [Linum perenne]